MEQLEKKLKNEVEENTKIIACRFPLPNCKPIYKIGDGIDAVWVYEINNKLN